MIRMRAVAIRILILAAMLAILMLCAGPAVQYGTVTALQKMTGGRVDIESTNVGIWPPRITYRDLRLADPRKEREDAVRIGLADLQIDADALLHRKYRIANATLAGVEFSVARSSSGQLLREEQQAEDSTAIDLSPHLRQLSDWVATTAKLEARETAESLETVQTARALEQEWKSRIDDVSVRAQRLETKIKEIKANVGDIDNPLRDLNRLQQTVAAADQVRQDLLIIRNEAESMPARLTQGLQSLDEARRRDQEKISAMSQELVGVESFSELGPGMIRTGIETRLATLQQYVQLAQQTADLTVLAPEPSRVRGTDYDLDGRRGDDAWLVRRCELNGILRSKGKSYDVTGVAENLASGGRSQTKNGRIRFRIEGGSTARVDYERPSLRSGKSDTLALHIPRIELPAQAVGNAEEFQVALGPSQLELWVRASLSGSALSGEIYARQRVSVVDVTLDPKRSLCRTIEASLDASLAQLQEVETRATLTGTVLKPSISDLNTTLGPALQTAFAAATEQAAQASQQALQQKIEQAYAQQRQKLDQVLALQHAQLMSEINQIDARIGEAQQELMAGLRVPNSYLERIGRAASGLRR